jgi:hypothetical protein
MKPLAILALTATSWAATITSGNAGLHYSTAGGAEFFANGSMTGPDFSLTATAFSGGIGSLAPYCYGQIVSCTFKFGQATGFSSLPFEANDNGTIYSNIGGYFLDFELTFTGPTVTVSPFTIPPFATRPAQHFFTFPSVPITAAGTFTVSTAPNGSGNILVSGSFNLPGTASAGFQDEGQEYLGYVVYNFAEPPPPDPSATDTREPAGLLGTGLLVLLIWTSGQHRPMPALEPLRRLRELRRPQRKQR